MTEAKFQLFVKRIHNSILTSKNGAPIGKLSFVEVMLDHGYKKIYRVAVCSNLARYNGLPVSDKLGYDYSYVVDCTWTERYSDSYVMSELIWGLRRVGVELIPRSSLTLFDLI